MPLEKLPARAVFILRRVERRAIIRVSVSTGRFQNAPASIYAVGSKKNPAEAALLKPLQRYRDQSSASSVIAAHGRGVTLDQACELLPAIPASSVTSAAHRLSSRSNVGEDRHLLR